MTHFDLNDDDVLLRLLSEALDEADPVPDGAVALAGAVASLSDVDAELATLVADTVLIDDGVLMRHDLTMEQAHQLTDRMVSFETPQASLDVEIHGDGRKVLGVITPPMSVAVDLETTGDTVSTQSDDLGRFHLESGPGPCRIRIHVFDGAVVTPWIAR